MYSSCPCIEYLISKDSKALLQGQLEPVTTCHAVPSPVVEIPAHHKLTASAHRRCCLICRHVHLTVARNDRIAKARGNRVTHSWATTPSTRE